MDRMRAVLHAISPISDSDWEMVLPALSFRSLQKGEILLSEGQVGNQVYFIREGLLRLYYLRDGEEHIRQFFFENGFAADLASCITGAPALLTIDALEPCELTVLDYEMLTRAYDTSPSLQKLGRKIVEYNFLGLARRMTSLFLLDAEARYEELVSSRPKVVQRIPQYMIASYLGVTPEGLSRIRKRLAQSDRS